MPGVDVKKMDVIVKKGMDERVEMYSAFADAFGNRDCVASGGASADLEVVLREKGVTDVFIVGIAGDYCVKCTAIDAAERGFRTYVIEEATKCVDPGKAWEDAKTELAARGAKVVRLDGPEMKRLKEEA